MITSPYWMKRFDTINLISLLMYDNLDLAPVMPSDDEKKKQEDKMPSRNLEANLPEEEPENEDPTGKARHCFFYFLYAFKQLLSMFFFNEMKFI